ncbi:uncharacterized protein VTP21DRAFT_8493 [Calcarisporiella thermophila]|uniref:uncharacterized protein n=1 Tax=Calcarisporiella thermophila TaxID=911321 RepID=UPI003742E7F6
MLCGLDLITEATLVIGRLIESDDMSGIESEHIRLIAIGREIADIHPIGDAIIQGQTTKDMIEDLRKGGTIPDLLGETMKGIIGGGDLLAGEQDIQEKMQTTF